ncbi:MAG TPA: hypothetical protein VK464_14030 [Symbiobacteriaceae bacterium]|jgi:hypothetical protein|nr:hypothetical protein [Symbiobacteriaceae bacterium]
MSVQELASLLSRTARDQVNGLVLPVEFGTIEEDYLTGADLKVRPDSMKVDLSFKFKEVSVADGLLLRKGDRVILVGANGGQDYCVLARLSADPAASTVGLGTRPAARKGDQVDMTPGSPTYGLIITGSDRVVIE